jgi:RNA ligase (TIGR02306 family)
MATIEVIDRIEPHNNADRLELATVLGYSCVIRKEEFKAGERIIFISPDYCLPPAPSSLDEVDSPNNWAEKFRKLAPKRIRAIKLRGVFSEGLCVSSQLVSKIISQSEFHELPVGSNLTERLGITKYETVHMRSASESLPYGISKTDETRWNQMISRLPWGEKVTVTLKIDGQSASYGVNMIQELATSTSLNLTPHFFVTSRSVDLKLDSANRYTEVYNHYKLNEKLLEYCLTPARYIIMNN